MSISNHFLGGLNCYIFKILLHDYTQRVGILAPVYETSNEGRPHEPCFKSTVIVDNVRYDSLPGFSSRKASEQSAAEVALMELAKSGKKNESIASPLESGLCKQLLEQYARKMSCAPSYHVFQHPITTPGKMPYTCTVEVGGSKYAGAAARSQKAAQFEAARIALLAIQSKTEGSEANQNGDSQHIVIPCKKKTSLDCTDNETTGLKPTKMCSVWRKVERKFPVGKVERKFPDGMFNKLKTFIAEQGADDTDNTFDFLVKDSGSQVANNYGLGAQDVGCKLYSKTQANKIQAQGVGKLTMGVKHGESNITLDGKVVLPRESSSSISQDGAVILNFDGNSQVASHLRILAVELRKFSGVGLVSPMTMPCGSATAGKAPFRDGERIC